MDVLGLVNRMSTTIFGSKSDDDFSDRLNYRYTVGLLVLFSIILTTRQYGSEVIKCWVPAHFTSNYEQYVSQICWIQNTYYFHPNQNIPKSEVERSKSEIKYYQWVSFVLLFQALLFYMPRIFWKTFSVKAGLNICDLVDAAHNYKAAEKFEKQPTYMNYLVKNIDQFVDDNRRYDDQRPKSKVSRCLQIIFPCFGRFLGNYIVILYFIVKIVYILNTVAQVFIISGLLGKDFWLFGLNFILNILRGQNWTVSNSKYFPKVTLCDFMIREVGNPNKSHKYTVQCVLPINLFNQQIFTAIWFWYIIVLIWNIIGFIVWVQRCFPVKAHKWIKQRVALFNDHVKQNQIKERLNHFLVTYLEHDGIFMIRMIANNTSDYVATDLVHHLWCQHHEKYGHKFESEPHQCSLPCLFDHSKSKFLNPSHELQKPIITEKPNISKMYETSNGNYASFPNILEQSNQANNLMMANAAPNTNFYKMSKPGEYFGIDPEHRPGFIDIQQPSRINSLEDTNEKNFSYDENTNLIRKRENNINNNVSFNVSSTKV